MSARGPTPRRGRSAARTDEHKRQHISVEAARIMAEEGIGDFHAAKRKAAMRLNLPATQRLPSNEEVEAALKQHLQLFHGARLAENLRRLRRVALEAMRFLTAFEPRLVGTVLSGAVTPESEIQLHAIADTPEAVAMFLREHTIPYQLVERRMRFGGERHENISIYRFSADSTPIELYIFLPRLAREAPLSPVDGRPMKRATLKDVENLLGTLES